MKMFLLLLIFGITFFLNYKSLKFSILIYELRMSDDIWGILNLALYVDYTFILHQHVNYTLSLHNYILSES